MATAENQAVAETLAANVRAFRQLRGMDQDTLARRMQSLGHTWRQVTVSEVERRRRMVTVPELVALTLTLAANVEQLLDPRGPEQRRGPRLALNDRVVKITGDTDDTLLTQLEPVNPDQRLAIEAKNVTALVCSHKTYAEAEWDTERHFLREIEFVYGRPDLTDVGPEGTTS